MPTPGFYDVYRLSGTVAHQHFLNTVKPEDRQSVTTAGKIKGDYSAFARILNRLKLCCRGGKNYKRWLFCC